MPTLSVVIPALNEEQGILEVVDRVLSTRDGLRSAGVETLELIVVDDGSTDRTPDLLRSRPEVKVVRHSTNMGYGAALKTGFAAAKGDLLGFLDADGTYPPEHFPNLCQVALTSDAQIVIGSRMNGSESQMPRVRRLGNMLFAGLVTLISGRKVTDSASGMRVFWKSVLPRTYPLPDGLNLTPVMSTRALHEDLKVVEVPIPYRERLGRSKLSAVRDGTRFAKSIVWTALSYNPVRPLGIVGLICLVLAGVIGAGLLATRLAGVTTLGALGAFALFTALVLAVAGVSIVALGMSFNYFVALFYKQPLNQGFLRRPSSGRSLVPRFGWLGALCVAGGLVLGLVSLALGLSGWPVSRLWLYYLGAASLTLVGIQLVVAWVQIEVLEALKMREGLVASDMRQEVSLAGQEERGIVPPTPFKAGSPGIEEIPA